MSSFDSVASIYDVVLPAHVSDHYYNKRIRFLSGIAAGGRVLDVCAGTGRIARGLADLGCEACGLDLSFEMLKVREEDTGYRRVQANSRQVPFRDNTFDLSVSIAAMHHVASKEGVRDTLCEMQRVTKPGGHIVIWDHNPLNPYWKILMKRVPQDTGEERLIGLAEIVSHFDEQHFSVKSYKMGFMPDFVPKPMVPLFRILEKIVESLPVVNMLAAHNVVVAKKH